ncbi:histidine phosphatase family protein [Herbiconiux sp. KACC 21604]|uniref:histidine phosphatase family protein n=1 Tax=unclassified Herbiconiux TaxID=2618217 RepID=UPI00149164E0|nr:histidine phosphatase family protein [Herbiconiux sp. SALV-R1]QJU52281.1 histidine phosphatase family protein [Herbiconiux sp. SALV-R1]WPO87129.1 histidine phosphatase family protein [Herbiconiux sp. KACC 21604]
MSQSSTPSAAPSIVLVRHGETEWSLSGQHTGRTDIPLTERGIEQARAVGRALGGRRFGLVLTSPLRRSVHTAELAGYGVEAQVEPDLTEWDYGAYEGLTSAQISERFGEEWNLWRNGVEIDSEGRGEEVADLLRRDEAVIRRARRALNQGDDVLVFSHGHFLRTLAATWTGLPVSGGEHFALDTASVSVLGFEHGNQVVRVWNRTPWAE